MLHYILQTIVFQLIFLVVYELLLKRETFFSYNRIYLLVTPILALLLPLLKISALQNAIPAENFVMLPEVFLGEAPKTDLGDAGSTIAAKNVLLDHWLQLIYFGGLLFSLGFFFNKLRIIRQLFHFKPVVNTSEMKVVEVPDSDIACTFYKTIFLGTRLSEKEREQILSHEIVHVRQRHTLDLLFFELLRIIFWFNPLIYIYQSRISAVHEFMADAGVVKNVKKQDYFQQLLNSAFNTKDISFINQFFNHSIIKKRIVMLQKTKSNSVSKFKFLIILPLMAAMLTYVACSSSKTGNEQVSTQQVPPPPPPPPAPEPPTSVPKVGQEMPNIPFAVVEELPVFPGCESFETREKKAKCITQKINQFVNTNFNTSLGKELGLTGLNRIYVQFKIAKNGVVEVLGARAPHPALEEEARRVVNLLPKMTPGKQRGEEVGVLYSLPISFMVPEATSEDKKASDN
ncbi:M56 family metallopeptidase [Salinimicrobium sp. WS361]|uniref:M56 family metallopeptidase n=1 Tax=Salinimicrobium sp. WS361 TaxID=3425123 RepID=UPI003D6EB02D